MKDGFHSFSVKGYTDDKGGFSWAYSWWRSATWGAWSWCCHESGNGFGGAGAAVVDDFGNLTAVRP